MNRRIENLRLPAIYLHVVTEKSLMNAMHVEGLLIGANYEQLLPALRRLVKMMDVVNCVTVLEEKDENNRDIETDEPIGLTPFAAMMWHMIYAEDFLQLPQDLEMDISVSDANEFLIDTYEFVTRFKGFSDDFQEDYNYTFEGEGQMSKEQIFILLELRHRLANQIGLLILRMMETREGNKPFPVMHPGRTRTRYMLNFDYTRQVYYDTEEDLESCKFRDGHYSGVFDIIDREAKEIYPDLGSSRVYNLRYAHKLYHRIFN